jgi:HK97 gp10 family phage protein
MNDYLTFEVKGLKEMGDQLAQLPGKIARRALTKAVREGANVSRDLARSNAPVGTKSYKDYRGKIHRPGLLKKSGVMSKKLRPRDWRTTVLFGVGFSKLGFYGRFYERGKNRLHHQAPHPFVVPSFENAPERIIEAIKSRLGIELEVIVREVKGLIWMAK